MIQIYHVPRTRSIRAIWLCEELGLGYEVIEVDFAPEYRNSDEWRAISPTGKVPAMRDGDTVIFESGAMVDVILERYGGDRFQPEKGSRESALCRQWCWFAEATLARPLGDIAHHTRLKPPADRIPAVVVDATARAQVCLAAVVGVVATSVYLVGESLTIADIMMGYSLFLADLVEIFDAARYPSARRYFGALANRPGWVTAISA